MFGRSNILYELKKTAGWSSLPEKILRPEELQEKILTFSYNGNYYFWNDNQGNWILQLMDTGKDDLNLKELQITGNAQNVDIFMVGAGKRPSNSNEGNGGGGGASLLILDYPLELSKKYKIQVGQGLSGVSTSTNKLFGKNHTEFINEQGDEIFKAAGATAIKGGGALSNECSYPAIYSNNVIVFPGKLGGSKNGGAGENSDTYAFNDKEFKILDGNNSISNQVITFGAGGGGSKGGAGGVFGGGKGAANSSESGAAGIRGTGAGGGSGYDSSKAGGNGGSGIIIIRPHKESIETQVASRATNALATPNFEALWQRINELETELSALKESNTTSQESNSTEINQEDNLND